MANCGGGGDVKENIGMMKSSIEEVIMGLLGVVMTSGDIAGTGDKLKT